MSHCFESALTLLQFYLLLMLLELVHRLVHIVFFPDKIFQTCLAVLLYAALVTPSLCYFFLRFTFVSCHFVYFCSIVQATIY